MKQILPTAALVLLLLLTACQSAPAAQSGPGATATAPVAAKEPAATAANPSQGNYPAPPPSDSYPEPGFDSAYPVPSQGELFPPAPGDENLESGNFYIDLVELKPSPDNPNATEVVVAGSLPTPCNELRARVEPPDNTNTIKIRVYSLIDKDKICTQQLEPFEGPVAVFSGYPAGTYKVVVNDEPVGEFNIQ